MTRRLAVVLAVTAVLLAAGIVVGAKMLMGAGGEAPLRAETSAPRNPGSSGPAAPKINAMAEGYRLAAVVNYRSWQLHKKMWLTPVHCAADTPHLFACSFQSTHPDVCRFVRFRDDHGNMEIVLAGLVPTTFCKGGKRVAVQ